MTLNLSEVIMIDNIYLKKLWQENTLFEIEFMCISHNIKCISNVYVSYEELNNLCIQLSSFLDRKISSVWKCGERGNETLPCISFKFIYRDKLGHVRIEIFTELNDGGNLDEHTACFYVNSEIGLLEQFKEKIESFREISIGEKISLAE